MSGLFLTAVGWKVLDLAMHAMSLSRGEQDPGSGEHGPTS
jgi:hypothetical protein